MRQTQEQAIQYLLGRIQNANLNTFDGYKIVSGTNQKNMPYLAIFAGKSSKPFVNYCFQSLDRFNTYLDQQLALIQKDRERKHKQAIEAIEKNKLLQPGVVMYSTWGYEQTNVDFYIITGRKGDFITLQEIGKTITADDRYNDRGQCLPNPEAKIGEPFKRKVKFGGCSIKSYSWASIYDGRPISWSSYH